MSREGGSRGYRLLIRLLPREERQQFGKEMEYMFLLRLRQARGPVGRLRVWVRAVWDVIHHAVAMHLQDAPRGGWDVGTLLQDLRFGLTSVRSAPGFAVMAVATLAVGVAASTSTFSVVHAVLLRSLPFQDPERLVVVWPEVNANKAMTLLADERMHSLDAVAGVSGWSLTLTGAGEPREVDGLLVSPGYFDVLGVRPVAGRSFAPGEDLPGAAGVVILAHHLWVSAFASDPAVVGRTIELSGAEYDRRVVIGVMPSGVEHVLSRVDVWIPLEGDPALGLQADDSWYVNTRIARLADGATLEQANAEVGAYAAEIQSELPGQLSTDDVAAATVQPLRSYVARNVEEAVWVALGGAGLVLLIGCFNVANLLLARGDARTRDLAVRAALGAGRGRMTRMLLTEATILGGIGGATGVALALILLRTIVAQAPDDIPGMHAVSINPAVLAFAVIVTVASTLATGLVPAIRLGRTDATSTLGGRVRGAAGNTGGRLTRALIGGQVAIAVVVTVGSGLMLRSLSTLLAVDPGLDGQGVVALKPSPPGGRYSDGEAFFDYYARVLERIEARPEVTAAGAIHLLPGTSNNWSFPTYPEGVTVDPATPTPTVNFRAVRGAYFETTRLPLMAGRTVNDGDRIGTEPVVAVNEAFVERFWPGQRAVGKSLTIFSADGTRYSVVGVVGNVHQHGREVDPLPEMYFSHGQIPWDQMSMWIVARIHGEDPMGAAAALRDATWSVDPDVPIGDVVHLADALGQSTRTTRFLTLLLTAFGALALGLCAVGVFSVTAYASGRRRAEFGVRLALGSSRIEVVRSALGRSLGPVAVGLALGLVVAALASRILHSVLFRVEPSDPLTFAGVAGLLAVTAIVAAVLPAWWASRVDPVSVLGSE